MQEKTIHKIRFNYINKKAKEYIIFIKYYPFINHYSHQHYFL